MQARAARQQAGVQATLVPGTGIVLTAQKAVTIPMTGLSFGGATKTYGTAVVSWVRVEAGETVVIDPNAPLSVITSSLRAGQVGAGYSAGLQVTGGDAPYT